MSFPFKAADYPSSPGCYLMRNKDGRMIYIGKSKNLRSRLRSYFSKKHTHKKIIQLVQEIASIEVVLVNNEAESLLLENNLIKKHKPPFNRALKKDNSGYAYLQLTAEPLPRLDVYYRNRTGKAHPRELTAPQRLGPFKNARFRDALLEFVTEHYGLRTCKTMPKKVCLLYHIGKCSGVCEEKISKQEYLSHVDQASVLLAHRGKALIQTLYQKMDDYASRMEFEKAQQMLVSIRNLEQASDKQIVDREAFIDQDVIYFGSLHAMVAKVQAGMLTDFQLYKLEPCSENACDQFLMTRYANEMPDELIVNRLTDRKKVQQFFKTKRRAPLLTEPKRGLKHDLLQLCKHNYEYRIEHLSPASR
ncbi:GIY-YIG nuclease family protein [Paenibacillus sp. 2TAB23]|uniref:GIY-YIG nuclease family protein n=1 Tax=Paenibacillus sp. 2TAB23 TaxID=3233004 RepID=UPI003F973F2B